ncbi:MAG: HAMP domain-containing histidine kinase [Kouleothrix sp.]|jgi:signal transduction histidine kinase|nr:HAMP domain-containing histidine kinase [Kouleothrix sp.]
MSIRLRLTLLYTGILAATLASLGLLLYLTVMRGSESASATHLIGVARRIADERDPRHGFEGGDDHEGLAIGERDLFIELVGPGGDTRARSANLASFSLPLSDAGRQAVLQGREWRENGLLGGERVQVVAAPTRDGSLVLVGQVLSEQQRTLDVLRYLLLVAGGLATLIALVAGWWLAGAALRPIDRITQTARAIELERDFTRRVDTAGPQDEVGRLATTFNAMLSALQGAYDQTEQTLHVQRRFVADASHELRTPLTTIRGNLALLRRNPPIAPDDQAAVLADTIDEGERLSRLLNQLLTLARADAGITLAREQVDLAALAGAVCRRVQPLAAGHTLIGPSATPVLVIGDSDAITQVLTILVDNALKFTPAGGTIAVTVTAAAGRGAVQVRDNGPGIAPTLLPHLFERFVRGDAARTGEGTGLGLAIAHDLAVALGGDLTVASELGVGSTFALWLPLR